MEFTNLTKRQNEESVAPETIDISLTGRCQLDCAWCWGEEHTIGVNHEANDWNDLLNNFASEGTSHVVFTGGEPFNGSFSARCSEACKEYWIAYYSFNQWYIVA